VLDRAAKLTKSWGAFRAFVFGLATLMVIAIIIRPEAALCLVGIFSVGIAVALFAAYKKLLD
jgi:hypothetical protein